MQIPLYSRITSSNGGPFFGLSIRVKEVTQTLISVQLQDKQIHTTEYLGGF